MKHMIHKKYGRSTDLFVCIHGVSYPDLCQHCRMHGLRVFGIWPPKNAQAQANMPDGVYTPAAQLPPAAIVRKP